MLSKDTSGNNAIVVQLQNVRDHPNADRLRLATVLGATVIVGLDAKEGDIVIYFDSNLRLSHKYLFFNNLYSNAERNSDPTQKGYFGKNGRVRAQKFRGEISNGYVADIDSIRNAVHMDLLMAISLLPVGTEFTHLDGVKICEKYLLPVKNNQGTPRQPISRMFHKHWDTKQLMRELDSIPAGATCWIEEKIHGTSGRTGNVLVDVKKPWWKFWGPTEEWKVVSGTRKVDAIDFHLPEIRQEVDRRVAPHLHKGEEIYYEIYGYDKGKHIQAGFPYDCRGGEWKAMLYRVTLTTPDGFCIDMDREYVYNRAAILGLEKPYFFETCDSYDAEDEADSYAGGVSALDAGTLREGVVVWFKDKSNKWMALKLKSQEFFLSQDKLMEKDIGDVEDGN